MASKLNIWLFPIVWLFVGGKRLSQYLFGRGIWKSVEFEIPVIAVHTLMESPAPLEILRLLECFLQTNGVNTSVIINKTQLKMERLKVVSENEYSYLSAIDSKRERSNLFVASNLALGISELSLVNEGLQCVVLGQEKFIGTVRPRFRVLVIDYKEPFYYSSYWPEGGVIELKSNGDLADLILVFGVSKDKSIESVKNEIRQKTATGSDIVVIFENESADFKDKKKDQLINIQDRDTFEKSLIAIIEQDH